MLKQRARLIAGGLRLFDLMMLAVAFPAAYLIRDRLLGTPAGGLYPISTYWPLLAASILVWQIASWTSGLYGAYRTVKIRTELLRLSRTFAVLVFVIAAGHFIWKQTDISRLFFALYYGIAFALLVANRVTIRVIAHSTRRHGHNTRAYALVGVGEMTREVREAIASHPEWGYTFAGYIVEEGMEVPADEKVLGQLSQMGEILESNIIDDVIFGVPRERLELIEEALLLCEEQGVGVRVLLNFFPNTIAKMTVEDVEGIPLLAFASAPSAVLPLVMKRVFDVVVSAFTLLLMSPVLLGVALAIKLESRGPIFFRQRRVGLNGRPFWVYKFRSMCQDAEQKLAVLRQHNEMDGPVFKMRADPRVTRVGRFIRKTSLDEFPQFWNVLRGEMSVVGPRPPLPSEVKLYKRWQRRRLSVKPGITCTWQVSGRNEIDFTSWMKLDLHYIDNWSLWRDLKIVLLTIPAVLLGKGAR